jgi:integrase
VAKLLALEGAHEVRARKRLIKDSQQLRWIAAVRTVSTTARDLFILLACTGLRLGEALSLRWENVDFRDSSFLISNTKNGQPHELPIGSRLHKLLTRRRRAARKAKEDAVFQISPRNVRFAVAGVVKSCGVPWSPHDLRRGFVTHTVRLEIPLLVVKRMVNHAASDVTSKHYVALDVDSLRPYMQQMENVMFALWGPSPEAQADQS